MRRGAILAAALLLAPLAAAAPGTVGQPVFQFGRIGGNIEPFEVRIQADGTITGSGPVRITHVGAPLSAARLATLLHFARTQRFWSLPQRTLCRDSLPDFASLYVTIHAAGRTRTVRVRGSCSVRFAKIYRALSAAAGVTP
jgi:hypothetical protein